MNNDFTIFEYVNIKRLLVKLFRDYFNVIVEKYNGDYNRVYEYFDINYNLSATSLEDLIDANFEIKNGFEIEK